MSSDGESAGHRIDTRRILRLAWPVLISMLSYHLMTVADTIFVGQLGTKEVAAVGLAAIMSWVVGSLGGGLLDGLRVAVAHRTGASEDEIARRLSWQGLWIAGISGLFALAVIPWSPQLCRLISPDREVADLANVYLSILLWGTPAWFFFSGVTAFFQGRGDTRTPMVGSVIANLLNIVLDAVLVFGLGPIPAMGVAGAAWATVIARCVGLIWLLIPYYRALRPTALCVDWARLGDIVRLGYPISLRWGLEVTSYLLFSSILAQVGAVQLAAHIIVVRIISTSFLPGVALGDATAVLAGQCLGGGNPEGARQAYNGALRLALGFMVGCGVLFVLVPEPLILIFGAEAGVVVLARDLLLIAALFQFFDAIAVVSQSAINGAGGTRFVAIISVAGSWGIKIPIGYVLAVTFGFGAVGAWIGLSAEIILTALLYLRHIRSGRWLKNTPVVATV